MRKGALALSLFAVIVAGLSLEAATAPRAPRLAPRVSQAPADLVLTNGRIVTVEDARPEVEALAVRGDRIEALGTADEIKRLVGPSTKVIDLQGQLAIPGFIESHGHLSW